jgi:peptidoglycan/LPS O-acetylase OafA/YrhL
MYLLNSLSVYTVRMALGKLGLIHPLIVFPCGVGVTVAAAFLSYRYFETPFLELKKRFARVRPDPAGHSTAGIAV